MLSYERQHWALCWETGRFIDTGELSPPLPSAPRQPLINNGTRGTRIQMFVASTHQLCGLPIHSLIDSQPAGHTRSTYIQEVSNCCLKKINLKTSGLPAKCYEFLLWELKHNSRGHMGLRMLAHIPLLYGKVICGWQDANNSQNNARLFGWLLHQRFLCYFQHCSNQSVLIHQLFIVLPFCPFSCSCSSN